MANKRPIFTHHQIGATVRTWRYSSPFWSRDVSHPVLSPRLPQGFRGQLLGFSGKGIIGLQPYGPNAARHLKRQIGFSNCPDILVNTAYGPVSQELAGFTEQVGHHGGIGGPQNHAFVFHPVCLPAGAEPIVTAVGLYKGMRSWRDQMQSID